MSFLIGEVRTEQATEHAQLSPFFIVSVRACSQNTHVLFLYKVPSNKADVLISIYLTLCLLFQLVVNLEHWRWSRVGETMGIPKILTDGNGPGFRQTESDIA